MGPLHQRSVIWLLLASLTPAYRFALPLDHRNAKPFIQSVNVWKSSSLLNILFTFLSSFAGLHYMKVVDLHNPSVYVTTRGHSPPFWSLCSFSIPSEMTFFMNYVSSLYVHLPVVLSLESSGFYFDETQCEFLAFIWDSHLNRGRTVCAQAACIQWPPPLAFPNAASQVDTWEYNIDWSFYS